MSGFLVIDKPAGITSHDVVAKVRRVFQTKRVGHAGTLDPMATGVLVLGIGGATRLLQYITDGKKAYLANIYLGIATDTDDKDGNEISTASVENIQSSQIQLELGKFVGKIMQRPSSVSAIKIDGKPAHERVRAGEVVEIKAREVEVFDLQIQAIEKIEHHYEVKILVTCSSGTYIRAIARDLGENLKCGGHLIELRRTLVAPFDISQAKNLETVQPEHIIDTATALGKLFKTRALTFDEVAELRFGRFIDPSESDEIISALDNQNKFVALIQNKLIGPNQKAVPILVASESDVKE
jgi:tRNA pseudouridine55 synthase